MDTPSSLVELDSRLTELIRAQAWIDEIADFYHLSDETRFAIQLCLEEALANVVLHGYLGHPGHPIVIRYGVSDDVLSVAVEDEAPAFFPRAPATNGGIASAAIDSITPGGNGIRLIHRFAASVSHQATANGNRLTMSFPISSNKRVSA